MGLKVFCERAGYFITNSINDFLARNPMVRPTNCEVTPLPTHFTLASVERSERSQADESLVRPYVFVVLWYSGELSSEKVRVQRVSESLTADKAMEELFDL